ncbi:MAG: tripartite tricarboxylate transporter substrate binding protein [Proteobacteria bacterium]|nr:tripartite tricarboxylate transporter substrate binding protein [Burkholderiales bacterium]
MLIVGCMPMLACAATPDYPRRTIRMIVAFSPGGGTDITGRIAAQAITEGLGQAVVVDNRPGSGGIIGTVLAARALPDGYTLITGGTGSHAINPALYASIPYDPVRDFAPVTLVASTPYLMVVTNSLPVKSVREFIGFAKAEPGRLNMASSGAGGMPHLAGELFQLMAGVKMTHVPYKGTGAVFPDLISGQVQLTFGDLIAAFPHVKGGRLRALAITSPKRVASLPDVPTVAEAGLPGYEAVGWFGVFAPAATPGRIVDALQGAIAGYLEKPEARERLAGLGADVVANRPQEFAAVLKADIARWARVVRESGAKVE